MIASKILISTTAAVAVVGAIGMDYAQSTTPSATTPDAITITPGSPSTATVESSMPVPMPTSPAMQTAPTTPSSTTTVTPEPTPMTTPMNSTSASTDTSTLPEEPMARADRN